MKSDFLSLKISDKMRDLFSEEEQKEYLYSGKYSILAITQLYISRVHQNQFSNSRMTGSYDLSQLQLSYLKLFFPTQTAKRSWLYLQSLIEADFGEKYFTDRKGLSSYLLVQTTAGKGKLTYLGKVYELNCGDVFLIDCNIYHRYETESSNGWSYRLAHFSGTSMPDYFAPILKYNKVVFNFNEKHEFNKLFKKLFEINQTESSANELLSNNILTQLLTIIISKIPSIYSDNLPERIRNIKEWLSIHYNENLKVDEIAKHFSISKYFLCHEYRKHTGQTIFSFIEQCRLNAAKELLIYSDLPISSIAEYVGFSDQTNFGRVFKKSEKTSPSAYRKQWKGS